jgi:hypothetical protein
MACSRGMPRARPQDSLQGPYAPAGTILPGELQKGPDGPSRVTQEPSWRAPVPLHETPCHYTALVSRPSRSARLMLQLRNDTCEHVRRALQPSTRCLNAALGDDDRIVQRQAYHADCSQIAECTIHDAALDVG